MDWRYAHLAAQGLRGEKQLRPPGGRRHPFPSRRATELLVPGPVRWGEAAPALREETGILHSHTHHS